MNLAVPFSHLLLTVNCSANFAIYCYKVGGGHGCFSFCSYFCFQDTKFCRIFVGILKLPLACGPRCGQGRQVRVVRVAGGDDRGLEKGGGYEDVSSSSSETSPLASEQDQRAVQAQHSVLSYYSEGRGGGAEEETEV